MLRLYLPRILSSLKSQRILDELLARLDVERHNVSRPIET